MLGGFAIEAGHHADENIDLLEFLRGNHFVDGFDDLRSMTNNG